jgi:hypothetical protein
MVLLGEGQPPDLYLIPATEWLSPNALLVDRDYVGLKSKPEWGVQLSGRTRPLLAPYRFDAAVSLYQDQVTPPQALQQTPAQNGGRC